MPQAGEIVLQVKYLPCQHADWSSDVPHKSQAGKEGWLYPSTEETEAGALRGKLNTRGAKLSSSGFKERPCCDE